MSDYQEIEIYDWNSLKPLELTDKQCWTNNHLFTSSQPIEFRHLLRKIKSIKCYVAKMYLVKVINFSSFQMSLPYLNLKFSLSFACSFHIHFFSDFLEKEAFACVIFCCHLHKNFFFCFYSDMPKRKIQIDSSRLIFQENAGFMLHNYF